MKQTNKNKVSKLTGRNWAIDFVLFLGGVLASLTGVYFLFLVSGGYQGGRNPTYGINFLFEREIWEFLHRWTGIVMVAAALLHIILHWKWITRMTRRVFSNLFSKNKKSFNKNTKLNLWVNVLTAFSFVLTGISGVYFFFVPLNSFRHYLFSGDVWDMIHTWGGLLMVLSAVLHFMIHWRWIKNVTLKLLGIKQNNEQKKTKKKLSMLPNILIALLLVLGMGGILLGTINRTMVVTKGVHILSRTPNQITSEQNGNQNYQSEKSLDHEGEVQGSVESEEHIKAELEGLLTVSGNIYLLDNHGWEVLTDEGNLIEIHGRTFRYMIEMGFTGELDNKLEIQGYYENDEFEIVSIHNLNNDQEVQIRNEYGSPMWSNSARGN